jgi:hypothetical protein
MDIYKNSITGGLQKAMKEIYPVCAKLVGNEFFYAMSKIYINETPSTSYDLADYGENFSEFITDFQPASGLAYLADVAKLEWGYHRAFSANNKKAINFQKLTEHFAKSSEKIIFTLAPGNFLLRSSYPIHKIWQMNQDNYTGNSIIDLSNEKNPIYLFIWRHDLTTQIDELTFEEWQMLLWIQSGLTLGEINEKGNLEILPPMFKRGWIADFI